MKALTVKQPWAWAIIHGGKVIENRTVAWSYRGPLAIHTAKTDSARGFREIGRIVDGHLWDHHELHRGVLIGVVDLVDAHLEMGGCCQPWGEQAYVQADGQKRVDVCHLVLENPRPVEPIRWKGRLGLWDLPAGVIPE